MATGEDSLSMYTGCAGIEHIAVGVGTHSVTTPAGSLKGVQYTQQRPWACQTAKAMWVSSCSTIPGWVEQGDVSVVSRHEAASAGCTGRGSPVARRVQCTLRGSRSYPYLSGTTCTPQSLESAQWHCSGPSAALHLKNKQEWAAVKPTSESFWGQCRVRCLCPGRALHSTCTALPQVL